MILYLDTETRARIPLDVGIHRYAEEAEIMLVSWAEENKDPMVWSWNESVMDELLYAVKWAEKVVAHNAEFDFTILSHHGVEVPVNKMFCTMSQARSHGLPGGLEKLSAIFNLKESDRKIKEGRALVLLFCKPRPDGTFAGPDTHPEKWAQFKDYTRHDVIAMREISKRMPYWNNALDRKIWELDYHINQRGFMIDIPFVKTTVALLRRTSAALDAAVLDKTEGEVESANQRNKLLKYLFDDLGVSLPDLQASTLERRINDPELPEEAKELLCLRQQSSRTSTAKYATLLKQTNSDQRLRGGLVYCGAPRTGRWAGRGFQPQNLPRPKMPVTEVATGIRILKQELVELCDDTHTIAGYAADGLRGTIIAPQGKRLLVADLSNIEGRIVAWLADEQWKLDAFKAYDAGTGPDLYTTAYAKTFAVDEKTVTREQRQVGKVMELMLGFGGGVGAFLTGAKSYRIDLDQMAVQAWPAIPRDAQIEAEVAYTRMDKHFGLSRDAWLACEALKRLWRRAHPRIEKLWYETEQAARTTLLQRDTTVKAGYHLFFDTVGAWLRLRLPSGRFLCYPAARVEDDGKITFKGQSPYTRRWTRQSTWGGTLVENATQAVARDVLAAWMLNVEKKNMKVVLTVHDEILCETDTKRTIDEVLTELPLEYQRWGLPLAAKGFITERYYKEV